MALDNLHNFFSYSNFNKKNGVFYTQQISIPAKNEIVLESGIYLITQWWNGGVYELNYAGIVGITGYKDYGDIWLDAVPLLKNAAVNIQFNPAKQLIRHTHPTITFRAIIIRITG